MKIAVLVSGSGTLLEAMLAKKIPIALVVSDRSCRGLEIAQAHGVEPVLHERKSFRPDFDRDAYSAGLVEVLNDREIELVAMAGFGTVLATPMFDAFAGRVINTHPSLLPSFPGWHAVRDAIEHGVKITGCTLHVATPVVDDGPILAQQAVPIHPNDDEASLHERIKVVERNLYVETLQDIVARGQLSFDDAQHKVRSP